MMRYMLSLLHAYVTYHACCFPLAQRLTCLRLDLVSEHLTVHVEQIVCHCFICPLVNHRGNRVETPADVTGILTGSCSSKARLPC